MATGKRDIWLLRTWEQIAVFLAIVGILAASAFCGGAGLIAYVILQAAVNK